jgi:uncharacterized protein YbaP (TraB family)
MRSNGLLFILVASLLTLSPLRAWSQAAAPEAKRAAAALQNAAIPARGTLYRVRHQGNTSYLFGTIHVGKPSFYPLEARATQAFADAGKLAVEFDIRNTTAVMASLNKYGMYGPDDSIEKHLSADSLAQLRQAMDKLGLPLAQMARMKPWMLANLLLILDMEKSGLSATQGTDLFLLSQASAQAKPVEELETADYQLSLFDAMSPQEQELYLRDVLKELASGEARKKLNRLMAAWNKADGAAFDAILREEAADKSLSSQFMVKTLLGRRNVEMAAKVVDLLQREKTSFVAVGLLHLVGAEGVPGLLRKRGFEVEKIY